MEVSRGKDSTKNSLNGTKPDINEEHLRPKETCFLEGNRPQVLEDTAGTESTKKEEASFRHPDSKRGLFEASASNHGVNKEETLTRDSDSSFDSDDTDRCSGLLSVYWIKEAEGLYKNLTSLRISDMALEKNRRNHPNPNFLCNTEERSNYTMVLEDIYFKQKTKNLKKEIKLKYLIEEFFMALDKFVLIANYCLKSTEIEDEDEDFNFALVWVRDAFHWLGIEGAKYYARKSPGPYNGWISDVEFLMNRYFFSPEFNHVNGFGIEQSMHEGYRFVESSDGKYYLSYQPYPGYYDVSEENKRFCTGCNLILPRSLSLPDDEYLNEEGV
ncbi:hypothetical protein EROM_110380 [Encephalitozoon romaleae SJ-2008]|uniref:Uncharacterized protein n=1 Tax=Encephalitozoon romaleae (strain SJ-2008) TaxID=1178016 RepID=I7AGU8_ENCRO|nr:hypothetical protein EROM_110380 [Encephalitozoon romaleae SJ-2008]AFN84020.1 hypothetical protein EROM_110380 [Encephalitozoon romaleae SJ-2008]